MTFQAPPACSRSKPCGLGGSVCLFDDIEIFEELGLQGQAKPGLVVVQLQKAFSCHRFAIKNVIGEFVADFHIKHREIPAHGAGEGAHGQVVAVHLASMRHHRNAVGFTQAFDFLHGCDAAHAVGVVLHHADGFFIQQLLEAIQREFMLAARNGDAGYAGLQKQFEMLHEGVLDIAIGRIRDAHHNDEYDIKPLETEELAVTVGVSTKWRLSAPSHGKTVL